MSKYQKFFEPFQFGGYKFKNRLGMGAMTRCRADPDGTPNDIVKAYYVQRSEHAGFISTEAMKVAPNVSPWGASCQVYTQKAVEKWKEIIEEVHKNGTYIFAQLVHGGRSVHPDFNNGIQPMAPSPIAINGTVYTPLGKKSHVVPREMTQEDIDKVISDFRHSIVKAKEAGFDGIEFHSANGYLIDQFLRSGTNKRTDKYGGSIENRCRFLLDLVDVARMELPSNRIGLKISPVGRYQDMYDENPKDLIKFLLTELQKKELLYVVMGSPEGDGEQQLPNPSKFAREYFKGLVISDGKIPLEERYRRVCEGECDIANFASLFYANSDLGDRLKNDWPLNQPDFQYMYAGGAKGYSDIPKYDQNNKI